ncbi:MAG: DUF885 domain-containing protein, partial [Planctomycetota bacterium]
MNIWQLSDAYVQDLLKLDPITSTYLGDSSQDHLWSDNSVSGARKHHDLEQKYLQRLGSFEEKKLPPREWVAFRVFKESLTRGIRSFEREEYYYDLNTITSSFQGLRSIFDVMETTTEKQWNNILSRLQGFSTTIQQYQSRLKEGAQKNKVVAKRQVRNVIKQAKILSTDSTPEQPNFFRKLVARMKSSPIPESAKSTLTPKMEEAVTQVFQAIRNFAQFLEKDYLPSATEKDGVGVDRYRYYAERFMGMSIDPLEAYEWGWQEYYRLETQLKQIAKEIDPTKTLPEVIQVLSTADEMSCNSQEEFASMMLKRQLQAIQDLDKKHFYIPEEAKKIEVKLAPIGASRGAYYQGPSEDFSRCGSVWYSYGSQQRIFYYSEIATAYHEGFPGHHLQICIARLQKELSRFHRLCVWYPGYGEGWALYTERLMGELGYYEKKAFLLGMLKEQMRRAYRVVIDIGLHLSL